MKRLLVMFLVLLFISGCTSNTDKTENEPDVSLKELTKKECEDEIRAFSEISDSKIKMLEDKITTLESELNDYQMLINDKDDISNNDEEVSLEKFDDYIIEDKTLRIFIEGETFLEDGVICSIVLLDNNANVMWIQSWDHIDVTELAINSVPKIHEGEIFIVIDGDLHKLDIMTGDIIWTASNIGHSWEAPLIDEANTIYTIGQYSPFLSAISLEGFIKWQKTTDEFIGISSIEIEEGDIKLNVTDKTVRLDLEGQIIE